jgi:hypothetical protein
MEDTVTYTSKVPASTWLTARCAFSYDHQLWTDTVFFLRKQWKLFRNLMLFKGYQKHFVSSSFAVWSWKPRITNSRKIPGFEWVTIMWSSFCAVLFVLHYIRFIYATLWKYSSEIQDSSVLRKCFLWTQDHFNVLCEYFMW